MTVQTIDCRFAFLFRIKKANDCSRTLAEISILFSENQIYQIEYFSNYNFWNFLCEFLLNRCTENRNYNFFILI